MIRDIILDNSQKYYLNIFSKVDLGLRKRIGENGFLSILPRYLIESLGLLLIALLLLISNESSNPKYYIPFIAVIALGAQRILPSLQMIYSSWSQVNSYRTALKLVIFELRDNKNIQTLRVNNNSIKDFKEIYFECISHSYLNSSLESLKNISFKIKAGEHVGIIGETGSGKSTLVDVLMGLLKPSKGEILIDNKNLYKKESSNSLICWRKSISHVPQNIYITDDTIARNIALGDINKKLNMNKVIYAAKLAKLSEFISTLPKGYETIMGERGSRLSGGQKQRLGIARALYKNAKLIIFDEATSALDTDTEAYILNSINSLAPNITLITIAHRYSAVKNCSKIIKLNNGKIEKITTPDEIL